MATADESKVAADASTATTAYRRQLFTLLFCLREGDSGLEVLLGYKKRGFGAGLLVLPCCEVSWAAYLTQLCGLQTDTMDLAGSSSQVRWLEWCCSTCHKRHVLCVTNDVCAQGRRLSKQHL